MWRERRDGFTVMELLVVIAVMILLAAILFPVLAQAREAARRVACSSRLKQLVTAHRLYTLDYDDTLPCWRYAGPPNALTIWTAFLQPYYRESALLQDALPSPGEQRAVGWVADYTLCAWGPGGKGTPEQPYWRWPGATTAPDGGGQPMRSAEVQRPTEVMQFAEGFTLHSGGSLSSGVMLGRHRKGGLNGAFVDGHIGWVSEGRWSRVKRDDRGYFRVISAADR
jgi:type II secretory pathway pseudopilin PulG